MSNDITGWRLPASIELTAHNQQQQQNRLREWERERGREDERERKKNFKIPTDKRYFFIWQREKCKFAIYQEHCQVSIIKIQWKNVHVRLKSKHENDTQMCRLEYGNQTTNLKAHTVCFSIERNEYRSNLNFNQGN